MAGRDLLTQAEIWKIVQTSKGGITLIRPIQSDLVVPIFTDQAAIQLIGSSLRHRGPSGKGIYDSFLNIVPRLNANLICGEINRHRNGHFSAGITVEQEGQELTLEMPVSDVLILTAKGRLPLFLSEEIIQELGTAKSNFENKDNGQTFAKLRLSRLREELKRCLDQEDYETAAALRDQIEELEKES